MASVYVMRIIAGDIGWIARAKTIGNKIAGHAMSKCIIPIGNNDAARQRR